jgi:hypothetical protein
MRYLRQGNVPEFYGLTAWYVGFGLSRLQRIVRLWLALQGSTYLGQETVRRVTLSPNAGKVAKVATYLSMLYLAVHHQPLRSLGDSSM